MTTNQGVAIGDNQNSLKAGLRGPTLLEDFILREKITHFDHERIPERIVHARVSAAHGYFEAYEPMTAFTRAAPFQAAGKITPVFVRFSTVAGERGSTDTAHVVPGIDFSNDPLLAGRIHSYVDTQITRLGGANFHEIPINPPLAPAHNNQSDGLHRQTIPRGRVAYEPNSLGSGCPFQAGAAGFVSFPQPVEDDKLRGKPEKFADHYTQATLFYDSQTAVEKAHIAGGFRFELSKLTVPAIRERMVSSLVNVSPELAATVAAGLGIAVPQAMPKVLAHPAEPEITTSAALSLTALPGDGGIRSRSVAMLVADGVDGKSISAVQAALLAAGAKVHLIAPRLGRVTPSSGEPFDATGTLENSPPVLFDGLVLPDGAAGVKLLGSRVEVMDFISNQYRHGKTILALGAAKALLDKTSVEVMMKNGERDPSILTGDSAKAEQAIKGFITALGKHRHAEREAGAVPQ